MLDFSKTFADFERLLALRDLCDEPSKQNLLLTMFKWSNSIMIRSNRISSLNTREYLAVNEHKNRLNAIIFYETICHQTILKR